MANWSIEAVIAACTTIGTIVGGAVVWASTKGLDAWIRWRESRLTERERIAKLTKAERKPFSNDALWEDKTLATGYKAVMFMQDSRIRELENKHKELDERESKRIAAMQQLHTAYLNCVQEHAEAAANYQACKNELEEQKRRYNYLERRLEKLRRKSNLELDDNGEEEKPNA